MNKRKQHPPRLTGFMICSRCGILKHVSKYYPAKLNKTGLQYHCKVCENKNYKERATLRRYGLTYKAYQSMVELQENRCLICGKLGGSKNNFGKQLGVDHKHDNGEIRGLLCYNCNMGLGYFNDSPEYLSNAIKYINKSNYPELPDSSTISIMEKLDRF